MAEYDCEEKAEQLETAIRQVKEDNERLRGALARWNEHLPGCAKWRHVTEQVGSLLICNGEDVLDEEQDCTCGYDGRWEGLNG